MYDLTQIKSRDFKKMFTPEEWELAQKYFAPYTGCFKKQMSDQQYLDRLNARVAKINYFQRALDKIGLDEDQLKEVPPITIVGFDFDDSQAITSWTGRYTNLYQVTLLLFSATQVYLYSYRIDMLSKGVKETCEEYFYRDIVNISTVEESKEINTLKKGGCIGGTKYVKAMNNYSRLQVVVPGDKLFCAIDPERNPDLDTKIKAAKAKIREKKA